jgi:hypothetical protein
MTSEKLSRRTLVASAAAALPALALPAFALAAIPAPATAIPDPIDVRLMELGERLEALVIQRFELFFQWAPLMSAAHRTVEEKFGDEWRREKKKTAGSRLLDKLLVESGCNDIDDRGSAINEKMQPLIDEIKDMPAARSFSGLRAKALVVLNEARPVFASHEGALTFPEDDDGASESLFLAVAEVTGLMPMVRGIQERLAAQAGNDEGDS